MIIAGIVTYNPDIKRLEENIKSISGQVDSVVIYDNNSTSGEELAKLADKYNIRMIYSDHNNGLGVALNVNI